MNKGLILAAVVGGGLWLASRAESAGVQDQDTPVDRALRAEASRTGTPALSLLGKILVSLTTARTLTAVGGQVVHMARSIVNHGSEPEAGRYLQSIKSSVTEQMLEPPSVKLESVELAPMEQPVEPAPAVVEEAFDRFVEPPDLFVEPEAVVELPPIVDESRFQQIVDTETGLVIREEPDLELAQEFASVDLAMHETPHPLASPSPIEVEADDEILDLLALVEPKVPTSLPVVSEPYHGDPFFTTEQLYLFVEPEPYQGDFTVAEKFYPFVDVESAQPAIIEDEIVDLLAVKEPKFPTSLFDPLYLEGISFASPVEDFLDHVEPAQPAIIEDEIVDLLAFEEPKFPTSLFVIPEPDLEGISFASPPTAPSWRLEPDLEGISFASPLEEPEPDLEGISFASPVEDFLDHVEPAQPAIIEDEIVDLLAVEEPKFPTSLFDPLYLETGGDPFFTDVPATDLVTLDAGNTELVVPSSTSPGAIIVTGLGVVSGGLALAVLAQQEQSPLTILKEAQAALGTVTGGISFVENMGLDTLGFKEFLATPVTPTTLTTTPVVSATGETATVSAAASAGPTVGQIIGVVATLAAAALASYAIVESERYTDEEKALLVGLAAATAAGTIIAAFVFPPAAPVVMIVGTMVTGLVTALIRPSISHEVREAQELGRAAAHTQDFGDFIIQSITAESLMGTLRVIEGYEHDAAQVSLVRPDGTGGLMTSLTWTDVLEAPATSQVRVSLQTGVTKSRLEPLEYDLSKLIIGQIILIALADAGSDNAKEILSARSLGVTWKHVIAAAQSLIAQETGAGLPFDSGLLRGDLLALGAGFPEPLYTDYLAWVERRIADVTPPPVIQAEETLYLRIVYGDGGPEYQYSPADYSQADLGGE